MTRSESSARPISTGLLPRSIRRPSPLPWITTTQAERGPGRRGPSLNTVNWVVAESSDKAVAADLAALRVYPFRLDRRNGRRVATWRTGPAGTAAILLPLPRANGTRSARSLARLRRLQRRPGCRAPQQHGFAMRDVAVGAEYDRRAGQGPGVDGLAEQPPAEGHQHRQLHEADRLQRGHLAQRERAGPQQLAEGAHHA